MSYYLRLYRRFVVVELLTAAEYRTNLALSVGVGVLQLVLVAATLGLLYRFTPAIAGWTPAEALLLLGVYQISAGFVWLLFGGNLERISYDVRHGELDTLLMRPVDSQFLLSTRRVGLGEGVQVLVGLALTGYAGVQAGVRWEPGGIALAIGLGICGLMLLYALWFTLATCAIWWVRIDSIDTLVSTALSTARYPLAFYPGAIRALLTYVVPVAYLASFPAEALLGRVDAGRLPVGIALACGAMAFARWWWRRALRHYSSASS